MSSGITTTYNERSWAIDVISHINHLATNTHRPIRRAGGESTIRVDGSSLFPDVLLYQDLSAATILQGWELKMPDTSIDDQGFVENAKTKAKTLGLGSFVLWNAQYARLYIRNDGDQFCPEKTWDSLAHINTREMVREHESEWKAQLEVILSDLNELFENGTIEGRQLIESYASDGLTELVLQNHGGVSDALKNAARRDGDLDERITLWWSRVEKEYGGGDRFKALARANLMNWLGKFLFAHILRERDSRAAAIGNVDEGSTPAQALAIFEQLSTTCNFWTIFQPSIGQYVLSDTAWSHLLQFNALLSDLKIGAIDQNQLSTILESIASASSRKLRGQYTTPPVLAQLISRLTLRDAEGRFLDCCCGSGTIPRAILELKLERNVSTDAAASQVWASDIDGQALQLTTFALAKPGFMGSIQHVFSHDAFTLTPEKTIEFRNPTTGDIVNVSLGTFHAIGSNLPFVSQSGRNRYRSLIEQTNRHLINKDGEADPLSRRADLAAYLPFELHSLLESGGLLGIIMPNAWLGTAWGDQFRRNIIRLYKLKTVVTSGAGRWFRHSDVVANLLILEKRDSPATFEDTRTEETRFVVLKRHLEEYEDPDANRECAAQIDQELSHEDSIFVRCVSHNDQTDFAKLGLAGTAQFVDCDWVKDLPMVPLKDLLSFRRGERRGWDRMFYPAAGHGIEAEYIRPILKSSTDIAGYASVSTKDAFCCSQSQEELNQLGHTGAEAWISRFENGVNGRGRPLTESLRRAGHHWYEMRDDRLAEFVLPIGVGLRFFTCRLEPPAFVNQRLIALTRTDPSIDLDLMHAIMNSTILMFMVEGIGFGRGLGVLDLNKDRVESYLHVLDPSQIDDAGRETIVRAFAPVKSRGIMDVADELDSPDRQTFDDAVFTAFNIQTPRQVIYDALRALVSIRQTVMDEPIQ